MAIRETKRSLKIDKRYRFCLRLDAIHKKRFDLVIRSTGGARGQAWCLRHQYRRGVTKIQTADRWIWGPDDQASHGWGYLWQQFWMGE